MITRILQPDFRTVKKRKNNRSSLCVEEGKRAKEAERKGEKEGEGEGEGEREREVYPVAIRYFSDQLHCNPQTTPRYPCKRVRR
jgi:hypothetical protein